MDPPAAAGGSKRAASSGSQPSKPQPKKKRYLNDDCACSASSIQPVGLSLPPADERCCATHTMVLPPILQCPI
jgi:hypothetical protein